MDGGIQEPGGHCSYVCVDILCFYYLILFVSRWMEACLGEELPAPTELEEGLRNGVWLAKLAHHFSPNTTPLRKIYDLDQNRYKVCHFIFIPYNIHSYIQVR